MFALKAVSTNVNTAYMVPPISQFTAGASVPTALGGPAIAEAIVAAIAWWRDAGVDGDFADAPQDWLAVPGPTVPAKSAPLAATAAPAPVAIAGGPQAWPAELAEFSTWWTTEPALGAFGAGRIAPRGPPNPALMVVVPMPEAHDRETLLSGPAGRLLDGFLAAAGLTRAAVYCAAACPARIAAPDWAALAEQGLGQLLAHHIGLVRPQRVMVFGQNGISTLLGNGSTNNPMLLPFVNHSGAIVPSLTAYDLETIVARPALKAALWNRWLDWMPA